MADDRQAKLKELREKLEDLKRRDPSHAAAPRRS